MQNDKPRFLRFWHTLTAIYTVFLTSLLWLPDPRYVFGGWEPPEGPRGFAHLFTFCLLGFLVEVGRRRKSCFFWAILLIFYAFLTEIVQEVLPVRTFDWLDIAQDVIGILLGVALGTPLRRYFTKRQDSL